MLWQNIRRIASSNSRSAQKRAHFFFPQMCPPESQLSDGTKSSIRHTFKNRRKNLLTCKSINALGRMTCSVMENWAPAVWCMRNEWSCAAARVLLSVGTAMTHVVGCKKCCSIVVGIALLSSLFITKYSKQRLRKVWLEVGPFHRTSMTSVLPVSQADFALRLLRELDNHESSIMSPISIFFVMAICAEGTEGTRNEILYALTGGKLQR